jgi:DNA-binding HxlR family transcriptional regulator
VSLARLIPLCRRRWSIPILARLSRVDGDRFVPLVHALDAGQEAVRETLAELIEQGWVRPNPGYGHPLRPEYILTGKGERLAPACVRLDDTLAALRLKDVCLRRWSLPALHVIGDGATRFSGIARQLGDVTDRALSMTLASLDDAAIVARRLAEPRPARFDYILADTGATIHQILSDM